MEAPIINMSIDTIELILTTLGHCNILYRKISLWLIDIFLEYYLSLFIIKIIVLQKNTARDQDYSGTPLKRSLTGHKNLAVLTGWPY